MCYIYMYGKEDKMSKPKTEILTTTIAVRFKVAERKKVEKLAKKSNMELAEYIRHVAVLQEEEEFLKKLKEKDEVIENQKIEYVKLFKTAKKAVYAVRELTEAVNSELGIAISKAKYSDIRKELRLIED